MGQVAEPVEDGQRGLAGDVQEDMARHRRGVHAPVGLPDHPDHTGLVHPVTPTPPPPHAPPRLPFRTAARRSTAVASRSTDRSVCSVASTQCWTTSP
ncbi:hypothetical protein STRIP9103_04859 [Streptomyces ipomoeae 91-03]|uniref:Uncharacterized protein n=1 Tax=Streptomyces ipomoeae 91-03 TaxID=698759 RepID=L1KJ21_9ACTN|nr:hypothetical protein STRIP9103_04859 [Streptomyces ipomoeae 91-03]